MNEDVIATSGSLAISKETLRAFAKGQLDEATEQQVLALLDTRPDLAAQVAAISSDSMLEKMKSHGQPAAPISLASQLTSDNQEQSDAKSTKTPLNTPPELAELTDYKILKEIGRGGMGVVYLAEHLLTGRKEVLKVLNERLMTNPEARKRFDQEIKCIAAMNHETIVRCYTVQQLPSAIVLCMEYVPGTNLHQFIHTNGPLPIHVACGIAAEVCRGLQHAMDNGLVHRDIKPSNIMLYKAEGKIKAKILDFGLARLNTHEKAQGLTDDGTLLGTLEYIAPEQCLNAAAADIRSDIYSLGCTLYHMLSGHPPFSGSTGELVLAHSQVLPPAINLIRPEVPIELANILCRMLAKQRSARYPSPSDVFQELRVFVGSRGRKQNIPAKLVSEEASARSSLQSIVLPSVIIPSEAAKDTSIDIDMRSAPTLKLADNDTGPAEDQKRSPIKRNFESPAARQVSHMSRRGTEPTRRLRSQPRFRRLVILSAAPFLMAIVFIAFYLLNTPQTTLAIQGMPTGAILRIDGEEVTVRREESSAVASTQSGERKVTVVVDGKVVFDSIVSVDKGKKNEILVEVTDIPNEEGEAATKSSLASEPAWIHLFDGTQDSFDRHWRYRQPSWGGSVTVNEQQELQVDCAPGEHATIGFITKENYGPDLHLSIAYRNFNGSPKVFDYTWHRRYEKPSLRFSVTLGGFRNSKPAAPVFGVGSIEYGVVNGGNFDYRAQEVKLEHGELCQMDLFCYQGNSVVKVNGQIVNDVVSPHSPLLEKPLHFWAHRNARINFQHIKIRSGLTESEFKENTSK